MSDTAKMLNRKQILEILEIQSDKWHRIYKDSSAKDAGLVCSFIDELLANVRFGLFDENFYGMPSCYGSEQLLGFLFKKAEGSAG